jgi:DNA-directed RNA polymerase specialized sigma24 family protein
MPTPTTVKAFYAAITGDASTHQRTIDAQFKRLPERRQRVIRARLAGETLKQIAARERVTHGTIASDIKRGIERMRKAIAGEPRFNRVGRRRADQEK